MTSSVEPSVVSPNPIVSSDTLELGTELVREDACQPQIPTPLAHQSHAPSPSLDDLATAATTIQTAWRASHHRRTALARIAALASSFRALPIPSTATLEFDSDADAPRLLFTPANRPLLAYEDACTRLLTTLDGIESAGDVHVRKARKTLVNEVENTLRKLEDDKLRAWKMARDSENEVEESSEVMEVEKLMQMDVY